MISVAPHLLWNGSGVKDAALRLCGILASRISAETVVVCNLQDTTYERQHLRPSDDNLLPQGMAIVAPVAFGIASSLPHRQIALDGNGNLLLGPGILTTLCALRAQKFTRFPL